MQLMLLAGKIVGISRPSNLYNLPLQQCEKRSTQLVAGCHLAPLPNSHNPHLLQSRSLSPPSLRQIQRSPSCVNRFYRPSNPQTPFKLIDSKNGHAFRRVRLGKSSERAASSEWTSLDATPVNWATFRTYTTPPPV
ncbi:hypothetical protein OCU04_002565 [Sclerotinia nivalis]|uniref:Uncharacterized protein n=1 Tax=Sclerotinia nivalis TaxID=352851 RepID=A0A9X0DMC0_9HELO|nr:hypothetical protein OCU04_002565 [Sclerotinia nivalis]